MAYKLAQKHLPSRCYGGVISSTKRGMGMHHAYATSLQACYNALSSRGLSTGFAIQDDTVWQLMPDLRCQEWATGSTDGNNNLISVEIINTSLKSPYPVSDLSIQAYCELVADLTRQGIVKPSGGKFVWRKTNVPHRDLSATACPGDYLFSRGEQITEKINKLLVPQTKLTVYDYWGGHNQQWAFVESKDGSAVVVNRKSGKAIDVPAANYSPGTQLLTYERNGGSNQSFAYKDIKPGIEAGVRITPVGASKMALAVSGATYEAGTPVILWDTYAGAAEQMFTPVIAAVSKGVTYYVLYSYGALKAGKALCLDEAA